MNGVFYCPQLGKFLPCEEALIGHTVECPLCAGTHDAVPDQASTPAAGDGVLHPGGIEHDATVIQPKTLQPQTSGFAISSMILGCLGIAIAWFTLAIPCILAVVLGHMARAKIRRSEGALVGNGMATAGLVTGYLGFPVAIIVATIGLTTYQDATIKASIRGVDARIREQAAAYVDRTSSLPSSTGDLGLTLAPASEALVSSLSVGEEGRITVTFASPLEGQTLVYEPMKGLHLSIRWVCTGGSLKEKYRPDDCQEPLPALQDQQTQAERPKDMQSQAPQVSPSVMTTMARETPQASTPVSENLEDARRESSSSAASTNSIQQMFVDPDPQSFRKSLYILSVPSGCKVYVASDEQLSSKLGSYQLYLMNERFVVGRTPLRIELEPGQYKVAVLNDKDRPITPRYDGEIADLRVLEEKAGPEKAGLWAPTKVYAIDKQVNSANLLVSLFWHEKQSLSDFVNTLPEVGLWDLDIGALGFRETFVKHDIPESDWEYLMTMLRKTGKALWYRANIKDTKALQPRDYMILEFVALGDWRRPNAVAERPVLELLQPTRAAHARRSGKRRD